MKMLFVYNPKSGKGKIRNHLVDIIDVFVAAGYEVHVHSTQFHGNAVEVVRDREKGVYDIVVCSGGDGTLDEVVTGVIQSGENLPIGYIPAGSTNDFARSLGISSDMVEAAQDIVNGKPFVCDIGRINGKIFVYVTAFGLFTEVSYATDQHLKNLLGHTAYLLEGAKSLASIKAYRMKVESEERTVGGDFVYGMISNSTSVGGFKNIAVKDVEFNDGKFEVVLVKKPTNLAEISETAQAIVMQTFDSPCIQSFKASKITIHSDEEVSFTLDGEYGGSYTEAVIENVQNGITIMLKDKENES